MEGFFVKAGRIRELKLTGEGYNRLCITRHGPMLVNANDQFVGRSIVLYGEYNPEEQRLLEAITTPLSTVVEVGANIGAHTVPLAKRCNKVYAFEPQRIPFQTLCANVQLNSLANVECYRMGLGEMVGSMLVHDAVPTVSTNFGGIALEPIKPGWTGPPAINIAPLDDFGIRADLIKIDVEGMELQVIYGAERTIERCRPYLYVENDRPEKSAELIAAIRSMGYTCYWHLPPLYDPDNFHGEARDAFPGIVSQNMVCVPEGRAFESNLQLVE